MKTSIDLTNISPAQLNKAKKHKVRECDEESPGKFLAYVDLGEDSYDVMVQTDAQGHLVEHACDCSVKGKLCVHLIALILFINSKQSSTKKSVKPKKKAPHHDLLTSLPYESLQNWLSKILDSNKEVLLDFMQEFSNKIEFLTEEEIKKTMSETVKAVIGKGKKIESSQAKKIIELWKKQHQIVLEVLIKNPSLEESVKLVDVIIHHAIEIELKHFVSGIRIQNYPAQMVASCLEMLPSLENNQLENAIDLFMHHWMFNINAQILFVKEFKALFLKLNNNALDVFNKIIQQHAKKAKSHRMYYDDFIQLAMDAALQTNTLQDHILCYQPVVYKNEYNLKLLEELIECKLYERAEYIAVQQITANRYEEFNAPYWNVLSIVYSLTGETEKRKNVLYKNLPRSFNRDDYSWMMNEISTDEEKKQFRSLMKNRALTAARSSNSMALVFLFWLNFKEGKPKEMLLLFKIQNSLIYVGEYLDFLNEYNHMDLLYEMAMSDCSYGIFSANSIGIKKIIDFISKNYSNSELKEVLIRLRRFNYYGLGNPVFDFIKAS